MKKTLLSVILTGLVGFGLGFSKILSGGVDFGLLQEEIYIPSLLVGLGGYFSQNSRPFEEKTINAAMYGWALCAGEMLGYMFNPK